MQRIQGGEDFPVKKRFKMTVTDIVMTAICVMIVAAQVYGIYAFRFEDTEAIRRVSTATAVYETGHISFGDPMMILIGFISRIAGTHPLKLIYTVLPVILVPLYYLCYLQLIMTVCRTSRERFTAFTALLAVNLWGYRSQVMIPAALLLSWFSFPVFVIHGLIPILAATLIRKIKDRPEKTEETDKEDKSYDEDYPEEWDMKKHRIINARNLAIALGVLAALLAVTVVILNRKINTLHDATVNLQEDMNRRCSIHEFIPQSGETEGYLIRGENGELTFVGGGSSENADELAKFLLAYGPSVDKWYVYGSGEEDAGAMRALTSEGVVSAGKVYVIDRQELKEQ